MINTIDLFAGCGGLTEGFKQNGNYNTIACVEWDKVPYNALLHRFKTKWHYKEAEKRVLRFDVQRVDELINGWDDSEYGKSSGLDFLVKENGENVDLIIGGPPCQAYSMALRNRDEEKVSQDYRNFLFESYAKIVKHYKPKAFVFENVPGILTAKPGDGKEKVIDIIRRQFSDAGYVLLKDLSKAIIDFSEYGVPQNRKRIIILGLSREYFGNQAESILHKFYYDLLPEYKVSKKHTVREAIGDLPKLLPLLEPIVVDGKKYAHSFSSDKSVLNHTARYNNAREINTFRLLTDDIASGHNKYTSVKALTDLYNSLTGKNSKVHKYYVLRWDEPSNLIPAHLYKDGLRHIHPDPEQARTITVREAARLQTFPDDFEFISGTAMDFKIIGNAVPPLFSRILADVIQNIL
ncbi:MAG: DNA cytosine methyltransferase [Oscillospiraceae bacterium]|jgi:DNA (cytosine-5)-methyltransferase 1|nr:DNA cytosine methyltransferase [Oscillospiraceae bacterium]